jgi:hypothetical protein
MFKEFAWIGFIEQPYLKSIEALTDRQERKDKKKREGRHTYDGT